MAEARVHIVDDDAAMRDSLQFLLEEAGLRATLYAAPNEILDVAAELDPGCILTDVRMPQMTGLELVRRLREAGVSLPVIVMTGHADVPLAIEAMRLGVADFIEKPFDDEVLITALESALASGEALRRRTQALAQAKARMATLSARESEVLQGLVEGKPNKIIAFDLGISARTVEVYRAHVMTKMGVKSLSELVRMSLLLEAED